MAKSASDARYNILGSTVAGLTSTLLGHPLDSIKGHLQTNPRFHSSLEVIREIQIQGLFRGMGPPLLNAIVMNTLMFSVFDGVRATYQDPFVAGMISGFATAMISTPTDYLKIHAQLHGTKSLSLLKRTSLPLLYRGHLANLAREGVFTMAYLGLYHKIDEISGVNSRETKKSSLLWVAWRSSITGAIAWIASYPFDTIKTVAQSQNASTRISYWSVLQSQPLPQLYRGCRTSTFRAILVTSSRMVAYEWVLRDL